MVFSYRNIIAIILLMCQSLMVDAEEMNLQGREGKSSERYLCEATSATGFVYKKSLGRWQQSNFIVNNKYTINKSDATSYRYVITQVGEKYPLTTCEKGFTKNGSLLCGHSSSMNHFKFNKNNGRYLLSYMVGYYNVVPAINKKTDADSDTPFLEIGICTSM